MGICVIFFLFLIHVTGTHSLEAPHGEIRKIQSIHRIFGLKKAPYLDVWLFLLFSRMLVAIAERYFSPHYFDHSLIGAQSDQQVLKDMVKEKLPDLYNHLDCIDIELSTITLNWFLAVFFDAVPFQVRQLQS